MVVGDLKIIQKFFCELEDIKEIVVYQITESFNALENTYSVTNLSIDMEDDIMWFEDVDDIIFNSSRSVLKGFLLDSVKLKIYNDYFKLIFEQGTIVIKSM